MKGWHRRGAGCPAAESSLELPDGPGVKCSRFSSLTIGPDPALPRYTMCGTREPGPGSHLRSLLFYKTWTIDGHLDPTRTATVHDVRDTCRDRGIIIQNMWTPPALPQHTTLGTRAGTGASLYKTFLPQTIHVSNFNLYTFRSELES